MKSINTKLLALISLVILGKFSIFANESEINQDCQEVITVIEEISTEINTTITVEKSPKERAMDLLRDFLDLAKHPNKKLSEWIDELIKELQSLSEYTKFCETLTKLKCEKNTLKFGKALEQYKDLLAEDIKKKIEYMLVNERMTLLCILSTRIKK